MQLYLLLYDDCLNDWCLHGVFNDTPESWHTITRITTNDVEYKVIKGDLIKERIFNGNDDDDDTIDKRWLK